MKHACKNFLYKSVKYSTRILTYIYVHFCKSTSIFLSYFSFQKIFLFHDTNINSSSLLHPSKHPIDYKYHK